MELPDGEYDVVVVDAEIDADGAAHIDVVIVAGESKGRVASLKGPPPTREPTLLMGLPARLIVRDGVPALSSD